MPNNRSTTSSNYRNSQCLIDLLQKQNIHHRIALDLYYVLKAATHLSEPEFLERAARTPFAWNFEEETRQKKFTELISTLHKSLKENDPRKTVVALLEQSGIQEQLMAEGSMESQIALEAIDELLTFAQSFQGQEPTNFLDGLEQRFGILA